MTLTKLISTLNWESKARSSLGIKHSKLRDHPLHSGRLWLEAKRETDGAEGLWRVHSSLYDLTDFALHHPGGPDWIKLTKGTDITEAFESHHIKMALPKQTLEKYYMRDAKEPRNSPFTFKDRDFYVTLRNNISKVLSDVPKSASRKSNLMTDTLLIAYVTTAILAARFQSYTIGAFSGVVLAYLAIAAHNYLHLRDNFRMYYFNFSFMDYREWRISHVMSHHLYTNTINDLEISAVEPFLQYLPTKKDFFFRYLSWLYSPIVYSLLFVGQFIKRLIEKFARNETISLITFLPFTILFLMIFYSRNVEGSLKMFLFIITIGSVYFGFVGLNAAHHHPEIFHDGDAPRPKDEQDWGIFQMDAVMDRKDITGSHFLVLTNFGDHALHHLFPTLDHGYLQYLYPVFLETCQDFGIDWNFSSQIELIKGQYLQLARTEPSQNPRKKITKIH